MGNRIDEATKARPLVIPSRADGEGPHIETLRVPKWKAPHHSPAWTIFS